MKPQLPKNGTTQPLASETEDQRFKQKCKELKKRILEVEENNEIATIALSRTKVAIRRLRLEYAILLERLEERAVIPADDSDDSASDPPTPPNEVNEDGQTPNKSLARNGASAGSKKSKRGGGVKGGKIRDPDLPKKPSNAYIIFCDLEKEKIRQDLERRNPGVVTHLCRGLTDSWKALDEESRKPYYKLYNEDKERYVREMNLYIQKKQEPGSSAEVVSPPAKKNSHKKQKLENGTVDSVVESISNDQDFENGTENAIDQDDEEITIKNDDTEEKDYSIKEQKNDSSSQKSQSEVASSQTLETAKDSTKSASALDSGNDQD